MTGGPRPTTQVSQSLRRHREQQRLQYKQISERLTELGQPIPTLGLTRIEKGERRVDLDEAIALARVFGVPPIAFIFPIGHAVETEVLPGKVMDPWQAARYFMGEVPLDGEHSGAEVDTIRQFRDHDRLVADALSAGEDLSVFAEDDDSPDRHEVERRWRRAVRDLQAGRTAIRNRGLVPPPLPPAGRLPAHL